MVAIPPEIPVTTPDDEPTTAIKGSLLLQVPPAGVSIRVVVPLTHTFIVPLIAPAWAKEAIENNNVIKVRVMFRIVFLFKVIKLNRMLSVCCFIHLILYKAYKKG